MMNGFPLLGLADFVRLSDLINSQVRARDLPALSR